MKWVELQGLCEVSQGAPISRLRDGRGKLYRVVQIRNLNTLELDNDLELEQLSEYRTPTIQPGEVLLSLRGSPIRAAVVPKRMSGCVASPNIAVLRLRNPDLFTTDTELDPYYLAGLFSSDFMNQILDTYSGGGMVPSLSIRTLRNMKIPVPALVVQHKFAEAFKAHNRASINAKRLLAFQRERLEAELTLQLGKNLA